MPATESAQLQIIRVETRREWKRFHALPVVVQAGKGRWVQPLALQARQVWAPRQPYFRHARARAWLALRGGVPVGRISAQIDELQDACGRAHVGQFGQFEAIDDPAVFEALLGAAADWLRECGKTEMHGPFDLSINQQCGTLVEGFDHAPMMMMNYNPPYYPLRLEAAGLESVAELLAYRGSPDYRQPPRVARLLARFRNRLEIVPITRAGLGAQAEMMRELFNAAWAGNWGFVPLTEAEFAHMVHEMKILVRAGWIHVARFDGRPAGFIVTLPDFNELIADLGGRLFPTGAIRLLWRLARKRTTRARIPLMGIAPEHHQTPVAAAIAYSLIDAVRQPLIDAGVELAEQSWILEQNRGIRAIIESIGMQVVQRYRLYRMELA